jgi:hypothetical protein
MEANTLEGLARVLQASISPVALISGVGLLILSQTNRLGRVTDRLRALAAQERTGNRDQSRDSQIAVLRRRARSLRATITAAVTSVLLASVLVLTIFTMAIFDRGFGQIAVALFAASVISLIVSLLYFLQDIYLSLRALDEELQR